MTPPSGTRVAWIRRNMLAVFLGTACGIVAVYLVDRAAQTVLQDVVGLRPAAVSAVAEPSPAATPEAALPLRDVHMLAPLPAVVVLPPAQAAAPRPPQDALPAQSAPPAVGPGGEAPATVGEALDLDAAIPDTPPVVPAPDDLKRLSERGAVIY